MENEFSLPDSLEVKPFTGNLEKIYANKLPVSSDTQIFFNQIASQLPSMLAANTLSSSNLYTIRFPKGINGELIRLKQGGFGAMLRNPESGRFVGTASYFPVNTASEVAVLGMFSAMSVATGQYFLTQINNKLTMINQKLDKVLEFLYGNKKAELIAEINFIRYAYQNYSSIMQYGEQRVATITSLQEARKVAMRDIEFYLHDMDTTVNAKVSHGNDLEDMVQKTFAIHESVDMAMQLYAVSMLLEIYYSQNTSQEYVTYLQHEFDSYIEKCDKHTLHYLGDLKRRVVEGWNFAPMRGRFDKSTNLQKLENEIESLMDGNSKKYEDVRTAISALSEPAEYVMSIEGDLYYTKNAS